MLKVIIVLLFIMGCSDGEKSKSNRQDRSLKEIQSMSYEELVENGDYFLLITLESATLSYKEKCSHIARTFYMRAELKKDKELN